MDFGSVSLFCGGPMNEVREGKRVEVLLLVSFLAIRQCVNDVGISMAIWIEIDARL